MGDIISTLEGIPQMFSHVFAVEISTVLPGEVQATGMWCGPVGVHQWMVCPGDYQRPHDNNWIHNENGNQNKGEVQSTWDLSILVFFWLASGSLWQKKKSNRHKTLSLAFKHFLAPACVRGLLTFGSSWRSNKEAALWMCPRKLVSPFKIVTETMIVWVFCSFHLMKEELNHKPVTSH